MKYPFSILKKLYLQELFPGETQNSGDDTPYTRRKVFTDKNRILLRENNARLQDSGKERNKNNVCRSFYISLNGRPDKREHHPAWRILSGFNR
ncbi:hypothetical protein CAK61_08950 [Salmonella enterica subsp. enterica serovar Typhi]|nr:hypothetical protein [Salmonella enterica subsp. enterica serovar Typhi]EDJ8557168.1 hypothetical protein [Salmonella enterica subsp. enterica serovar Typhi]